MKISTLRVTAFVSVFAQVACGHANQRVDYYILSAPPEPAVAVRYPDMLRSANVEGVAIVRIELDSVGRTVPGSVRVQSTNHVLFSQAVRNGALRWVFPDMARNGGRHPTDSLTVEVRFFLRAAPGCPRPSASAAPVDPPMSIVRERWNRGEAGRVVLIIIACRPTVEESTIRGIVISDDHRSRIAEARLSLADTYTRVYSGADGRFTLSHVAPGTQMIRVHRIGYSAVQQLIEMPSQHGAAIVILLGPVFTCHDYRGELPADRQSRVENVP